MSAQLAGAGQAAAAAACAAQAVTAERGKRGMAHRGRRGSSWGWSGWQERVAADPSFPYKVFIEQVRKGFEKGALEQNTAMHASRLTLAWCKRR